MMTDGDGGLVGSFVTIGDRSDDDRMSLSPKGANDCWRTSSAP
jgi:hypothetical protein